jgi:hypothetical protein
MQGAKLKAKMKRAKRKSGGRDGKEEEEEFTNAEGSQPKAEQKQGSMFLIS